MSLESRAQREGAGEVLSRELNVVFVRRIPEEVVVLEKRAARRTASSVHLYDEQEPPGGPNLGKAELIRDLRDP